MAGDGTERNGAEWGMAGRTDGWKMSGMRRGGGGGGNGPKVIRALLARTAMTPNSSSVRRDRGPLQKCEDISVCIHVGLVSRPNNVLGHNRTITSLFVSAIASPASSMRALTLEGSFWDK